MLMNTYARFVLLVCVYIYIYTYALILLQFTVTGLPHGIHGGRSHTIKAKKGSCRASLGPEYMPCSTRTFEYKMPLHNPKHSEFWRTYCILGVRVK